MNRKISILFGTVFTALFLQSAAIAYLVFQQTTLMRLVGGVEGSIAVGNGLTNVIGGEGTHGSWNTALGMNALMESTTAWAQTAVGFNALRDSGTGKGAVGTGVFGNTAVGYNSMVVNTEGYDNTAVGVNTLLNNLTGNDNSAFGINALRNNRNGYDNTAIGYDTLMNLSDGFQNVALGGWRDVSIMARLRRASVETASTSVFRRMVVLKMTPTMRSSSAAARSAKATTQPFSEASGQPRPILPVS